MKNIDVSIVKGNLDEVARYNPAVDVEQIRTALALVQATEQLAPSNRRHATALRPFSVHLGNFTAQANKKQTSINSPQRLRL